MSLKRRTSGALAKKIWATTSNSRCVCLRSILSEGETLQRCDAKKTASGPEITLGWVVSHSSSSQGGQGQWLGEPLRPVCGGWLVLQSRGYSSFQAGARGHGGRKVTKACSSSRSDEFGQFFALFGPKSSQDTWQQYPTKHHRNPHFQSMTILIICQMGYRNQQFHMEKKIYIF